MGENALDHGRMDEANLFINMALDHAARDFQSLGEWEGVRCWSNS